MNRNILSVLLSLAINCAIFLPPLDSGKDILIGNKNKSLSIRFKSPKESYIQKPAKKTKQNQGQEQLSWKDFVSKFSFNQAQDKARKKISKKSKRKKKIQKAQKTFVAKELDISPSPSRSSQFINQNTKFFFAIEGGEVESKDLQDQLNKKGNVHFSFYKRAREQYINAILKNFYQTVANNPHLQKLIFSKDQQLLARISYDEMGNAIVSKIFKSSDVKESHKIFSFTLSDMKKIPNIPKELLNESREFSIVFGFNVQGMPASKL